jgi:ketosteroid isomerase-like protein
MLLLSAGVLLACGTGGARPLRLTATDSTAIEEVRSAYVAAWLADDTAGVMATLDSAAVLLPPGRPPVAGHAAIRAFWWPADGSRTVITDFAWIFNELAGTSELAFTSGISNVGWLYLKDTVRSESASRNINLTILTRGANGRWRILRQMWGPALPS